MKYAYIALTIITIAFVTFLGWESFQYRKENPFLWMTEEQEEALALSVYAEEREYYCENME